MVSSSLRMLVLVSIVALVFVGLSVVAWTGPSQSPPNGNATAPINVGTTDQVKNAGLSVNALAVFGNSSLTGTLSVGGNVTALGYFHSSDERLKQNIETIEGLSILRGLRGVSFEWKDGTPSTGVIAQEIEAVLPSAVHTGPDGMKSVEYDQLVAVLIEAVKEQQVEIDALRSEIEILKAGR